MGRATRWLKGLFGIKKSDKNSPPNSGNVPAVHSGRDPTGLCHNPATIPPNISPAEASWLKSFYGNPDDHDQLQSKHAIAVAAATAAAADAAVAAAKAAAAVVRLTSTHAGRNPKNLAAIKIQSLFRGYLSRKALRALKGLVKLQALVRGYLVRKQAAATLYSMQALIRAQSSVRAHKLKNNHKSPCLPRKSSIERFDETRSEYITSIHSRRLSGSFETPTNGLDETPKIVEVDPGRPKSRSRRTHTWASDSGEYPYTQPISSPLPHQLPARLSIPDAREFDWGTVLDESSHLSTAQSTPRFANSCGSNGGVPATPAKSFCAESFYGPYPSYMAYTKSSKAKLRSHSAPKQRPDFGPKRKMSLNEMLESRNSISGVRVMQRSSSQAQEVSSFKNAIVGKIGRSSEFYREEGRENMW